MHYLHVVFYALGFVGVGLIVWKYGMQNEKKPGIVILLNGTSSVGKFATLESV